ncbi:MAG: exopolysaccharide transport family protein [Alphaproteobacteria bacterium]|nr:exopolysaccharide transport family protein [Alphaproteobacteria bacterium]
MSRRESSGQDVDIDIARLFAAVWERRIAVLSLVLIVAAAAFVVSSFISPRFLGETRILIENREPVFSESTPRETGQAQFLDERGVASQVEIINSTDLIAAVAAKLDLADQPEFSAAAHPSMLTSIMAAVGLSQDPYTSPPEERLIDTFREHLTVYQVSNSRVIVIEFWSTDKQLAADVANTMAQTYLAMQSGAKLVSNVDATAWLEPEIAELRDRVRLAEEKVADYRAEFGLLMVDDNASLASRQLSDISTELGRVRAEKADAQARAVVVKQAVERGETSEALSNFVDSDVIDRLRDRQADIQSNIADLSVTLLDGHPRIKGLRSQLRDINAQIKAEAGKILRGLENQAELARLREEELVAQLNALKADSARAGGEEVELRALEREATAQRDLLEAYLSRYREAASRSDRGNLPADARVIAGAIVPAKAYFPKPIPITIIAALATFLLSSIVIMLRELFAGQGLRPVARPGPVAEDRDFEPEFIAAESQAPDPIAEQAEFDREILPDAPEERPSAEMVEMHHNRYESANDSSLYTAPVSEFPTDALIVEPDAEYSVSAVAGHLIAKQTPIAVVVSPEGDKGSTVSVMLARMLANEGQQTLLVDMTGSACPSRMMAPQSDLPGITNVLAGECTTPEALHADRLSNAHILPQGTTDPIKAMDHSSDLPRVLDAIADVYDIVVIECGPATSEGVKQLLGEHNVEMIFSVVQPEEKLITDYLTDFYAEGFDNLLMMSPGAANPPNRPGRTAA